MGQLKFYYKKSSNLKKNNLIIKDVNYLINKNNNSEFNYLSLSVRNHKINLATSIPSNKNIVDHYVKKNLIEIDPLSCFEFFTKKTIVTYSEIKRYKNHGKCGLSFLNEREKVGLKTGFNYIFRTNNWAFTVVFGTDYYKNGFAKEENLIEKNSIWINKVIQQSLFILNENKYNLLGLKEKKFDLSIRIRKNRNKFLNKVFINNDSPYKLM